MIIKEPNKNYQNLWMAIAFAIAVWVLIYHANERKRVVTVIRNHQIDTIRTDDSVYVVSAKIDTVYYEQQRDPGEKSDYQQ